MQEFGLAFYTMVGLLELHWQTVITVLIAATILYGAVLSSKRSLINGAAFKKSLMIGVIIGLVFVFILPSLTQSSMSQVTYLVDWIFLVAISAAYAGIASVLVYPALVLMGKKTA
ncbi:hypothetical protein [Thiomicrorhabdus aquaedulcis]|uniref:hypothetical protein n=1 Tax=Thiomicrorhabdus aquaedulcis TaxID=2211106 RepID=UPI000FDA10E6|nr:hypothetical protein [Thiomicrorhabdus aquaedulcis]